MKTLKVLILPFFLLTVSFRSVSPIGYAADIDKSQIKWTGYAEAGGYAPTGTVKLKMGSIFFNSEQLISGKIIIDMPTISTGNQEMEKHLKGKDFFDVAVYSEATFALSSMKNNIASGILTIKGISQKVAVPVMITKTNEGMVLKATLKVNRTKFNIKYNSKSYFQDLGNYAIKNEFDLDISLACHPN
ncbi:YceI family protein [Mucilaginibacter flavidus]|uniref:YceI family protein n=1 Tax=Mucilaginibacter flavidus TaxID=2949309 RepID=UPI002093A49D|nr:YceI family protein [Mucilaginibacter flavidus]MCO5948003.1 YceI family protein [Mucilaginibacter flavidus]